MSFAISRRNFLMASAAAAAAGCTTMTASDPWSDGSEPMTEGGIRVRFLGSGAAGWKPEWAKKNPHMRRQSSALIENKVLIDFTPCSFDKLPEGCRPEALFQTHSHGDHYSPSAAVKSGVKRMYVQETWAAAAKAEVAAAAEKLGLPAPEVIGLPFGKSVTVCGLKIMGVPANHSTSRVTDGVLERTSLYLVEKGPSRLLYATDTGGIPGDAARMVGIDPHVSEGNFGKGPFNGNPFVNPPKPITAFVMEATNGDLDDDFRVFVHSSVQTVARLVSGLVKTKRFVPPVGQNAYLTHLGLKYRGWASERIEREIPTLLPENIRKNLPAPIRAASDGLEVVLG